MNTGHTVLFTTAAAGGARTGNQVLLPPRCSQMTPNNILTMCVLYAGTTYSSSLFFFPLLLFALAIRWPARGLAAQTCGDAPSVAFGDPRFDTLNQSLDCRSPAGLGRLRAIDLAQPVDVAQRRGTLHFTLGHRAFFSSRATLTIIFWNAVTACYSYENSSNSPFHHHRLDRSHWNHAHSLPLGETSRMVLVWRGMVAVLHVKPSFVTRVTLLLLFIQVYKNKNKIVFFSKVLG